MSEEPGAKPGPGHRQVEHTADLALEIWAESEEALLLEGARALVAILTEGDTVEPGETRTTQIDALDPDDRLVQWLNWVLLMATMDGFLFASGSLRLDGNSLEGTVAGEPSAFEKVRTELKSVTYHDLLLHRDGAAWKARIVVDV